MRFPPAPTLATLTAHRAPIAGQEQRVSRDDDGGNGGEKSAFFPISSRHLDDLWVKEDFSDGFFFQRYIDTSRQNPLEKQIVYC